MTSVSGPQVEMGGNSTDPNDLLEKDPTPFDRSGWSFAYTARHGRLLPAPQTTGDPESAFSSHNIDAAYNFGNGFNVGARLGYGTVAAVTLQQDYQSELTIPVLDAQVTSSERVFVGAFAGWQLPISHTIALGLEASIGRSSGSDSYWKASGDVLMTMLVTDHVGLTVGGSYGRYWYDISSLRNDIYKDNESAAIRNIASDQYQGPMIEGRYGLFFRF
jgi:hypothetical protein